MRLLLDEHLSPEIARQLRSSGHDVAAVAEHPELTGRADRIHFAAAPDQKRVIVTRDLRDFRPLLQQAVRAGHKTYGLVCIPRSFSSSRADTGRVVKALEELLIANPEDDALLKQGGETWLQAE